MSFFTSVWHSVRSVATTLAGVATSGFSAAESAWEATSEQAKDLAEAVEGRGFKIGSGFIKGAQIVEDGVKEGGEAVGKGLVEAGEYLSQHACDLALGSVLSGVFMGLAADGEEESAAGGFAVLAATQSVDNAALKAAALDFASLIVSGIYAIPEVKKVVRDEDEMKQVIAFLVFKTCKQNPKLVVGTCGQVFAGAVIAGVTNLVCEGTLPGGYSVWKGVQPSITPILPSQNRAVPRIRIASVRFPNVFLRMDGSGVTQAAWDSGEGGGHVNCQFNAGMWETFYLVPLSNDTVAIGSVAFPGVFLRMDGSKVTKAAWDSGEGGGHVNCQFGAGAYETFRLVMPG